jgi:hypothetical protein
MLKPTSSGKPTAFSSADVYGVSLVVGMGFYGMGARKPFPPAMVRKSANA